jgi:hypothetical protein
MPVVAGTVRAEHQHNYDEPAKKSAKELRMVSRKVLDEQGVFGGEMGELRRQISREQGVFTRDMDNLADRLGELLSTVQVLADRARGNGDLDMHFVLNAMSRHLFGVLRDLILVDEVLRDRGVIIDAHDNLRRKPEQPVSHLEQDLQ